MSPETKNRFISHFGGSIVYNINQAMNYLDLELRVGNISNYRIHSCLPNSRPLSEGRHLMIQADGIDIIKADFGLYGFIVSLVDRANEMHMFPSRDMFKTTVKNGFSKYINDSHLDNLYERAKEMSIYYE